MKLTQDIEPYEDLFVEYEYEASEPYNSFVYPTREAGLEVTRHLVRKRACEFAPPHGHVILDDNDQYVGMVAWLSAEDLEKARLRQTIAMAQLPLFRSDPSIGQRLRLAGTTLFKCQKGDWYLSRRTIRPEMRGAGVGTWLMNMMLEDILSKGAKRATADVVGGFPRQIAAYERLGYSVVATNKVVDEPTGRSLEYINLVMDLDPLRAAK